jgi:hypothetical protein
MPRHLLSTVALLAASSSSSFSAAAAVAAVAILLALSTSIRSWTHLTFSALLSLFFFRGHPPTERCAGVGIVNPVVTIVDDQ